MGVITSKENRIYKDLVKLLKKKYRDREGLYIMEGPSPVKEALRDAPSEVRSVVVREGTEAPRDKDVTVLSSELFDRLADTSTSQGILAVIKKNEEDPFEGFRKLTEKGSVVILDRLQDPGNVGTIIRTAEGAGMAGVIIVKGTADPFSPKVVRSCAGSIVRMPVIAFDSAREVIEASKEAGVDLVVTDVASGKPYTEAIGSRGKNLGIVIGNEGEGVSEEFRKSAGVLVTIPMEGKLESLNASVAAALLMYESNR